MNVTPVHKLLSYHQLTKTMSKEILDFDKEIHSILETKPPVSASKIGNLVKIAMKNARVILYTHS